MKKSILSIIILSQSLWVSAQVKPDSIRTILKDRNKIGFFTGPFYRNVQFGNSNFTGAFGGGAGFYFNHKYYIYLQTTSFPIEKSAKNSDKYNMNALGPSIGYCYKPSNMIHAVLGTQIYNATVINDESINPDNDIELKYLLFAPELYLEINLVTYVRFYIGPSYYFSVGKDSYDWIDNKYIRGFSVNMGLLVGKF